MFSDRHFADILEVGNVGCDVGDLAMGCRQNDPEICKILNKKKIKFINIKIINTLITLFHAKMVWRMTGKMSE